MWRHAEPLLQEAKAKGLARPRVSAAGHGAKHRDAHKTSVQPEAKRFGPPWRLSPNEANQLTVREVRV
eukprot:1866517-Amphidinium_carterae.1